MASTLEVGLLGSLEVRFDGRPVTRFEAESARALLAYLAAHDRQPQLRSKLAYILWGPDGGPTGLTNLRSALRRVRNALEEESDGQPCLLAEREMVQLHPFLEHQVDVVQFDALLRTVEVHGHTSDEECASCAEARRRAVALYRGPFLADVEIASAPFEQWRSAQQERYQRRAIQAMHALAEYEYRCGTLAAADHYARRQLDLEPWNEEAHRQLMRILFASGERSAALAQYELLRQALADEVDAVPSEETDLLYERVLAGAAPSPVRRLVNPYKGLHAFSAGDVVYFFGRERFTEQLLAALLTQPLVMLVGPSGSGKSSVINAGVMAALGLPARGEDGPASLGLGSGWQVAVMRPGAQPFQALAQAVAAWCPDLREPAAWAVQLRTRPYTLADLLAGKECPKPDPAAQRLLVIDQFEELYVLCRDEVERAAFLDLLLHPIVPGSGAILLSLRADFLHELLLRPGPAAYAQTQVQVLGAMTRGELERAVVEPARVVGVRYEPGLVDRLLNDLGNEPGRLPLLQFALAQLWDEQEDGWLLHRAYERMHGVRGALTRYADEVMATFPADQQGAVRALLLMLVEPGQDAQDIRRMATRAEVGEEKWPLAQRLADARLVVTDRNASGDETVELAHEALIREWGQLREWLAADREFQLWQQRMRSQAERWQQHPEDTGELLSGPRLAEAERWLDERGPELTLAVQGLVAASVALRQQQAQEQAERHARELEQIRRTAEAEHRRAEVEAAARTRLRRFTVGIALLAVATLGVAAFAFQAERSARASEQLAHARQLAAQAVNTMYSQLDLSLLLSLEAQRLDGSPSATNALYSDLDVNPLLRQILHGEPAQLASLAWGPHKQVLITDTRGEITTWDAAGVHRSDVFAVPEGADQVAALSPRGDRYATADGAAVTLWDADTAQPLTTLQEHTGTVKYVAFTFDGSHLLAWNEDGQVVAWDAGNGALAWEAQLAEEQELWGPVNAGGTLWLLDGIGDQEDALTLWDAVEQQAVGVPLVGHTAQVHSFTVSPDGRLLATASFDGTTRLWDTATGEPVGRPLEGTRGRMLFAAFSPDGATLATGDTDNQVLLWDVATQARLGRPLLGHSNWVRLGQFSADGRTLATGDEDGNVLLWEVGAQQWLRGHTQRLRSLDLSPDARTLVTSGFDKQLIAWDADTLEQRRVIPTQHENAIISVAFSPDGATLASVDAGGGLTLWDTSTWQQRFPFRKFADTVLIGVDFSPDGRLLAAGGFDGKVRLWDVATGELIGEPIAAYPDGAWAMAVAFSPAGDLLATGGADGAIKLWNPQTGAQVGAPLTGHTNKVTALAFTPDGSQLISSSADSTVRYWDVAAGQAVGEPLRGYGSQLWALEQPGAQPGRLETVSGDGALSWWDEQAGVLVRPALRTQFETEEMKAAPTGLRFYVASTDAGHGLGLVLDADSRPWAEQACAIANRSLTREEWAKYMNNAPYDPVCVHPQ